MGTSGNKEYEQYSDCGDDFLSAHLWKNIKFYVQIYAVNCVLIINQ